MEASNLLYTASVPESLWPSRNNEGSPTSSSELDIIPKRIDASSRQSTLATLKHKTIHDNVDFESTGNARLQRNDIVLQKEAESNVRHSTPFDQSKLFMKTLSYLLLCLSCSTPPSSSIGRTKTNKDWSVMLAEHSLATGPVCWLTSTKAKDIVESESLRIDQHTSLLSSLSKLPKARKRRIRRKRNRLLAHQTYLARLDNLERDLSDKEYDSLIADLSRSPLELVEYEEVILVEEKVAPGSSIVDFHHLSPWAKWKETPVAFEEELLSDFEEKLLKESTDERAAFHAVHDSSFGTEDSDDGLTEVDLWILSDATCGGKKWTNSSGYSDERKNKTQFYHDVRKPRRKLVTLNGSKTD
jgi:hypothetical protein